MAADPQLETTLPDISSYEARSNPIPVYRHMMATSSVHWNETTKGWYILRYEDVANGLRDVRLPASRLKPVYGRLPQALQEKYAPLFHFLGVWTLLLDPPEHTKLRKLISAAFAPKLINALRPKVQERVDELIAAVAGKGQINVIADLAYPLPAIIIADMLGLPPEDRDKCKEWSDIMAGFFGAPQMTPEIIERTQQGILAMNAYFKALLDQRRIEPKEDMITSLLQAEVEGEKLSEDEVLATCEMLIFGGHETTMHLIANAMIAFMQNPDQTKLLLQQPELIENAIEEALRYDAPVQRITRASLAEVEVGGQVIPAGQRVFLMLGAANHDPLQYESPEKFDITRKNIKHMSFGYGIHFCIGSTLGRMEAQIAVGAMLQRLPNLRLVEEVVYQDNHSFHAPEEVKLAFDN
jgi:hypothetical protein